MSILGSSWNLRAGAVNRFGPIVKPGSRIPIREKSTGSVRMLMPKRLMRTVAWPIQAAVTWAAFHFKGSGLAKAGAIGRQLSIVHSRQRCPSQRRTRLLRKVGCSGASMLLLTLFSFCSGEALEHEQEHEYD